MNINDFCKATESPFGSLVGASAIIATTAGVASGIQYLKNKRAKKDQPKNQQTNKSEKLLQITPEDFKKLTIIFKEATANVWKKTKNSSELKDAINEYNNKCKECDIDETIKPSDITVTFKAQTNNYADPYFEIFNNDNDVNSILTWILNDIIKYAHQAHPEIKQYVFNTGDGDEGCIYVTGKYNIAN